MIDKEGDDGTKDYAIVYIFRFQARTYFPRAADNVGLYAVVIKSRHACECPLWQGRLTGRISSRRRCVFGSTLSSFTWGLAALRASHASASSSVIPISRVPQRLLSRLTHSSHFQYRAVMHGPWRGDCQASQAKNACSRKVHFANGTAVSYG